MLGHDHTPAGCVDPDTHIPLLPFRSAGPQPPIMRYDPGLAASPRWGIEFEVEERETPFSRS